eukprot:snap_masked-scaffold_9-processed-gene-13.25-mRNA-1 protein AED:1.00 eAED:1.00 QI:0/0/0/0/1/1/2/0/955
MSEAEKDLGGTLAGWTASTLITRLRNDGLELSPTLDPDLIASYAMEYYASRNLPFPVPPRSPPPVKPPRPNRKHYKYNRDPFPVEPSNIPEPKEENFLTSLADEVQGKRKGVTTADGLEASLHRARLRAKSFLPQDEDGAKFNFWETRTGRFCGYNWLDVFDEGEESEFSKFGIGLSLYFKWLKWLFWTFFILSLITLPQLSFNIVLSPIQIIQNQNETITMHKRVDVEPSLTQILFQTTLGNIFFEELLDVEVLDKFYILSKYESEVKQLLVDDFGEYCILEVEEVESLYRAIEFIVLLVLLISGIWLRIFTFREIRLINRYYRKIEHYTLELSNLPEQIGEIELIDFLREQCFGNQTGQIYELVLARNDSKLINIYLEKGKILEQISSVVSKAKSLVITHGDRVSTLNNGRKQNLLQKIEIERRKIMKEYDSLYAKFLFLETQRQDIVENYSSRAVRSFVTFETLDYMHQALRTLTLPDNLKPKIQRRILNVKYAPPPSSIVWENLEVSKSERVLRQFFSLIVTLFFLSLSAGVAFLAQSYRVELTQAERDIIEVDDPCAELSFAAAARAVVYGSDPCHDFWRSQAGPFIFTQFSTLIIAGVNVFIIAATKALANFEKHDSVQGRELSISVRQHIALSVNLGLVILLANSTFAAGQYSDFISEWYANAGTQVLLTLLINTFTPHSFPLLGVFKQKILLWLHNTELSTIGNQIYLDKLVLGGDFLPSYRYSQQLTAITVAAVYSSGMQIIYPLTCFGFCLYYFIDKYLVVSYYKAASDFGSSLAKYSSTVVLFIIFIKGGFSLWYLSVPNAGLFIESEFNDSFIDRITLNRDNVFVLGILGVMILSLTIVFFEGILLNMVKTIFNSCSYRVKFMEDVEEEDGFINVSTGLQNFMFSKSVLNSYNILDNERYQKAFGISREFAKDNLGIGAILEREEDIQPLELPQEIRDLHVSI